jgi:hypothetical protein
MPLDIELRSKPPEREDIPYCSPSKRLPFAQIKTHASNASIIRKIALYRAMALGHHGAIQIGKQ